MHSEDLDFVFVNVFHQLCIKYKFTPNVIHFLFNVQTTLSKFVVCGVSEQEILFAVFLWCVLALISLCLVHVDVLETYHFVVSNFCPPPVGCFFFVLKK